MKYDRDLRLSKNNYGEDDEDEDSDSDDGGSPEPDNARERERDRGTDSSKHTGGGSHQGAATGNPVSGGKKSSTSPDAVAAGVSTAGVA